MNFQPHYDVLCNGAFVYYSDTIPSSAGTGITGRVNDFCINTNAGTAGQPMGWVCTVAGSPGTWGTIGQAQDYLSAGGSNNAITATGAAPLVVGLKVYVNLGTLTLQAGANSFAYNGGAAKSITSHLNVAANLGTAYDAHSIVPLIWDGTEWQDLSQ